MRELYYQLNVGMLEHLCTILCPIIVTVSLNLSGKFCSFFAVSVAIKAYYQFCAMITLTSFCAIRIILVKAMATNTKLSIGYIEKFNV